MEISDHTSRSRRFKVLDQPLILITAGESLVVLRRRIKIDKVPAGRVEAIVMRDIVPIIEVPGRIICTVYSIIFMVSNCRICDGVKTRVTVTAVPVPVVEFGWGAIVV